MANQNPTIMNHKSFILSLLFIPAITISKSEACTGITLKSKDGATIVARTIEWGGGDLDSRYVVVPRGYTQQSFTPDGADGMKFTSQYGYVGIAVQERHFVAEGINEKGLSAGLFYFPNYGRYDDYKAKDKSKSIADLQVVSWLLGRCATVDEVEEAVGKVRIINFIPSASTVHWRFADASGRQVVLEVIDGVPIFYENSAGVLTNSPGFEWHLTNLNNYVNLLPGTSPPQELNGIELASFGAGSGFLGLPGDMTPPSRFIRAAFYQASAPQQDKAVQSVMQCFQILNNFDIPIGIESPKGEQPADIPSATQWTSATDIQNRILYFRTMYDCSIRRIDLKTIDFSKITYRDQPLDEQKDQPIKNICII